MNKEFDLFDDYSVRDGQINDNLSAEQIRIKIRDDFIKKATVLILLCGEETKKRKHIDWEINASMFDTENNPRLGIVIINLPTLSRFTVRSSSDAEKRVISDNANWITLTTRVQYEEYYPQMPDRILDNFLKDKPISVINWDRVIENPERLKILIDNSYRTKNSITYDYSRPLRRNNS